MTHILSLLFIFFSFFQFQSDPLSESLKSELEQLFSEKDGTYSVWFQHLQEPDLHFSINSDTLHHAASTMKTPVMIELFTRAESGDFNLSDSILVQNQFYSIVDGSEFQLDLDPNSDDPYERMVGFKATIEDLNHAMITYSSNIATNLIIQLVGAEETTHTMRSLGANRIQVIRGLYDMKAFERGLSNRTTAKDLGKLYEKISTGEAVSPEMDQKMIGVLKDQFYRDVFPTHLPNDVIVANKTGFITGVVHDSGIIYLPDGQSYVLIFLSSNLPENQLGTEIGATVSEIIYRAISQRELE